jgi:FkbM family methyltransferase
MERGAAVLRRVGLGRVVDAVGARVASTDFEVEVDGLRLSGDHIGQLYYVREVLESGREGYFVELLREAARPGATVLEAGAHIGYVTLQAARAVGPSGRVIAFEPNPRTLPVLRRNLEANGLADRVEIVELALGSAPGRASFFLTPAGDESSLHGRAASGDVVEVEVDAADAQLGEAAVDVVKLDVEGGEVEALRGMRALLRRASPVVFAECNPEALAAAGTSVGDLLGELEALDYEVRWIDEAARELRPLDEPWAGEYVNLRCAPR